MTYSDRCIGPAPLSLTLLAPIPASQPQTDHQPLLLESEEWLPGTQPTLFFQTRSHRRAKGFSEAPRVGELAPAFVPT